MALQTRTHFAAVDGAQGSTDAVGAGTACDLGRSLIAGVNRLADEMDGAVREECVDATHVAALSGEDAVEIAASLGGTAARVTRWAVGGKNGVEAGELR